MNGILQFLSLIGLEALHWHLRSCTIDHKYGSVRVFFAIFAADLGVFFYKTIIPLALDEIVITN